MPHLHLLIASGTARKRLLDTTVAGLVRGGYGDLRRQDGGNWHSLMTDNMGAGLFDERGVVVVDDAAKLGPFPEGLAPLLSPPPPDSPNVIILMCDAETQALIPKVYISRCTVSKSAELTPWSKERDSMIAESAKKNGVSIKRDAITLLKELYEDSGEMASEAEKVAVFCRMSGRSEIAVSDVQSLCMSDGSRGMLKLLDGICRGSRTDVLQALDMLSRSSELLPLLSALHNRIRIALYISAFPKDGGRFVKALGARDYAAKMAETAARIYDRNSLVNFVTGLIRINYNEKSGLGASWRDLNLLAINLLSAAR
jgi:DNA polymerase-3 subunit delta